MELAKNIVEEARSLLKNGVELPAEIPSAPGFYLATHEDSSVHAFDAIENDGLFYKVGPQKNQKTQ